MKNGLTRARAAALLLAAMLLCGAACGCAAEADVTLSVMVPMQGATMDELIALYAQSHPDVSFEKSAYYGCGGSSYLFRRFQMNDLTDIVITTYAPSAELQEATLLDLSGYDFVHNYKASVLSNMDVNGRIYLVEGPSSVRGIAYNKTLFAEMGWEPPTSHAEFIALVKQIRTESDLMPLALPGKHSGAYFTLMSELSHCDFLQTPDGAAWAQAFAKGEAPSREGFQTGLSLLQDWLDAGVFEPAHVTLGDTEDYQMLADRSCAMAYAMGKQSLLVELAEASDDAFGMFPLYGHGEDSAFCATTHGLKVGLNRSLGEPGNERKLEAALALLELLSTEEGQRAFQTGRGELLPLAGSSAGLPEVFGELNQVMDRGHAAPFLYIGYEDVLAPAGEYLRDVCVNGGSLEGVYEVMDTLRRQTLENVQETYLATVTETLDERQTAQFVANALHAQGFGDLALVSMGRYNPFFTTGGGANGKLYAGGITVGDVAIPLSRESQQNIATLTLTGAQIRGLLEQGRILRDSAGNTVSYEYFCAGLAVERAADGSVKALTRNGAPLQDGASYTVAFSPLDYSEETALAGNPQDTGVPWQATYRAYVAGLGVITPEHAK